ncbi:methyl-accepting chemotaxis protein [Lachnotalea glycerini]|uniref:Methyl-accepting chemotaxis protein n=1 Tax=Lachnotalea glycerini TaxID=1763509 RepID=A0A371JGN6_9FIRM|nr:methyl-accepting chemotaxis protein [Lachnotalea glycerini]RDY31878.1 methyl-accepting chemotaxis protein [Lachnotalea glycerini]
MKNFKDFSISRKLLTGFLTLTFILIVVGGVGITGMVQINKMDTYMYKDKTVPITSLVSAIQSLYQVRVDSENMLVQVGDTQKLEELEQSYNSEKANFLSMTDSYLDTVETADSIALVNEAKQLFNDSFDPAIQKTLEAVKAGKQETAIAALEAQEEDIQKIFDDFELLLSNRMSSIKSSSDTNDSTAGVLTILLIACVILGAGIAVYLGLKISKMISKPIEQVVEAAEKIALGHVDVHLENINSKDETGQLANTFMKMLDGIKQQVLAAESVSNGDFTMEVQLRSDQDILGLALQKIIKDLNQTLKLISSAAEQVSMGSDQVSLAAQALASGATEQAAAVEELSASITDVATQSEQNVSSVRNASDYVSQAGVGINESNEHMKQLNTAMKEIGDASEKISGITKTIEDIAAQTNLLALNAAIEAARAGDAGKGFAVVADEVRDLAAKSAEAVKQTAELIGHSVNTVSEGERLANETVQILQDVAIKSGLVEEAVQQIAEASSEQALAIEQINEGLSQVSAVIQTNAATAEESSASSEELAAQAQTLQQEVKKFKLQ